MKQLFLCHHHSRATEVHALARQLRLRGIAPWVDKLRGGFSVGDHSADTATRVIQQDCFGTLVYATRAALKSRFIKTVEMPAAIAAKRSDPSYVITPFCRGISFGTLGTESKAAFSHDVSVYHGVASAAGLSFEQRKPDWETTAKEVLRAWVRRQPHHESLSIQFSTRQLFGDADDDLLRIDATEHLRADPYDTNSWDDVRRGLTDVLEEITHHFGRPQIHVHGAKHLTAAFLFGRVFSRNTLHIRQTEAAVWSSDAQPADIQPFSAELTVPEVCDGSLFVELAVGAKNIAKGVDQLLGETGGSPVRLSLRPADGPLDVDNPLCVSCAVQAYREIEQAVAKTGVSSIHLFCAAHQSLLIMLGQRFSGMPETHLYEWTGSAYAKSCVIPGGPAL